MSISITQVKNLSVELLNQSDPGSGYGSISAERYKSGEITDHILAADATIVRAICNTKGHGRRKDFLTGAASGIAYGAQLATRVGPLEGVQFVITGGPLAGTRHGKEWTARMIQELDRENLNPLALTRIFPHFILDGDTLYHNAAALVLGGASSVSVNTTFCVFSLTSACQAPDEFLRAVALASNASLFLKDGMREGAGAVFEGMLKTELEMLGVGG
jgi:hypothetical protein